MSYHSQLQDVIEDQVRLHSFHSFGGKNRIISHSIEFLNEFLQKCWLPL